MRATPHASAMTSAHVFSPRSLARALGVQYVAGGALALLWAGPPWYTAPAGRGVLVLLGALAVVLGLAMLAASRSRMSGRALDRASHACILSAQVVIAAGYAATGDPQSPVLLYLLWTTAYSGVFSRRARWLHVLSTTAIIVAAASTMLVTRALVAQLVFLLATLAVVTLLVSRMTDRLNAAALRDALTGLPNRRHLRAVTRAALARRRADGGSVTVLLLDLDRFKHVNDNYGHAVGDVVLEEIARRLRAGLRADDVVARLGGDEFAVVREERSGAADLEGLMARVSSAWAEPVLVGERRLYVDGCVGVAVADDADTPETLLRDADIAMYEAKAAGGSRWRVFDEGATDRSGRLIALESGLREAVARGELRLHYQPVVSLLHGHVSGVEALLRWTSRELGPVGPAEFIEVAEKCGLIDQLGLWALDRALADLAGWRARGTVDPTFQVAVNISAYQLAEHFPADVARTLADHGIPSGNLALEVTESAMMTGEVPGMVLDRLHALGVVLMLDDFGTGHSSLSHLRRHPVDVVKVDRSFVAGMGTDPGDRALVRGVVSLAHALGKTVVAEGVETAEQLAELRATGCDAAQGYRLSRPVPAHAVPGALAAAARAAATMEV